MAPSVLGAGSGIFVAGGGSGTASKTDCIAGNLIVVDQLLDGASGFIDVGSITNIEDLTGTEATLSAIATAVVGSPPAGKRQTWFGRAIADGTCSVDVSHDEGTSDIITRIYEVGEVTDTATVIQNAASFPETSTPGGTWKFSADTGTTISDVIVATVVADCLAVQLIAVNADQALAAFSGESGGDWTEPVAEFASASGGGNTLGIQVAELAVPGTIDGGTITISSADWSVLGFAFLPIEAGSGRRYKRIYGPAQLGSSAATLYTAPANTQAVIRNIVANNPSGSPVDVTLSVGPDAADTRIFEREVPANDFIATRRPVNHTIAPGEVLQGFASSPATVVLTVDGVEYGL